MGTGFGVKCNSAPQTLVHPHPRAQGSALPMADTKIGWHALDTGRGNVKQHPRIPCILFPPLFQHIVLQIQNRPARKAMRQPQASHVPEREEELGTAQLWLWELGGPPSSTAHASSASLRSWKIKIFFFLYVKRQNILIFHDLRLSSGRLYLYNHQVTG